jgi:hypothetical protein
MLTCHLRVATPQQKAAYVRQPDSSCSRAVLVMVCSKILRRVTFLSASLRSITRTSAEPFADFSFNPSCSCKAPKRLGAESARDDGLVEALACPNLANSLSFVQKPALEQSPARA